MRHLHLNLAAAQKIDFRRLAWLLALTTAVALVLNIFTWRTIANANETVKSLDRDNRRWTEKISAAKKTMAANQSYISQKEKLWKSKIQQANSLIKQKIFSYGERLNFLEQIIPAETQIKDLSLNNGQNTLISFTILAPTLNHLLGAYKTLIPYGLKILAETEHGGLYLANIQIQFLSHEKK